MDMNFENRVTGEEPLEINFIMYRIGKLTLKYRK